MENTLGVLLRLRQWLSRNVLILVLMEDTLGAIIPTLCVGLAVVLILVLMEDTLGEININHKKQRYESLNPCSNGRYSRSLIFFYYGKETSYVLILVLMEDTLGGEQR